MNEPIPAPTPIDWKRRRPGGQGRTRRISVDLSPAERELIERGALATDESLATFVRTAAVERARTVAAKKE